MSSAVTTRTFAPANGITHNVRVVTLEGRSWFVAADVCRALGLPLDGHTLSRLYDDEKGAV